jgi:hypothetical protein
MGAPISSVVPMPHRLREQEHVVVERHNGVEDEVSDGPTERRLGELCPPSRCGVAHTRLEALHVEEEVVAVVDYGCLAVADQCAHPSQEAEGGTVDDDAGARRWPSGEAGVAAAKVVDEEPTHGPRRQACHREQHPSGVHGGAPSLADGPACSHTPRAGRWRRMSASRSSGSRSMS